MSVSVLALTPVHAQTAEANDSHGPSDIIVTALKREEKLQKTPSAVTVVTASNLAERGITDIRGITNLAPSVQLNAENTATQVFIRGIGQSSDGDSNSPAVAVNFDGIYTPRYAIGMSLFDVSRVEILPGPQGLLYGQNAAGGAINVVSRTPGTRLETDGILEVGDYGLVHLSGGADLPLSDTLSLRAAGNYIRHTGYLSDGQNDANNVSGRLTLAWRPSSALSVMLRGELAHSDDNGGGIVAHPFIDPSDPWYNPTTPGDNFYNHETVRKLNAEVNYDTGRFTITYIPAFIYYDFGYRTPLSVPQLAPALLPIAAAPYGGLLSNGSPAGYFAAALVVPRDAQKQYTNEVRIASDNAGDKGAGQVSWLAGVFQLAGRTRLYPGDGVDIYNPAAASGGATTPYIATTWGGANYERHDNESYAAFGQLAYTLTDHLRVSVGGRYSVDRLHADGISQTYLPATPVAAVAFSHGALVDYNGVAATPAIGFDVRQTNRHFDWKIGAEADVSPHSLLYGNIQTGYNQGGFNLALIGTPQQLFKPETLLAFTIGIKNSFLGGRLTLNDEAFYYDYDNLQVASFDATKGSGFRVNVPKSRIYGNQVDLSYRLGRGMTLSAGVVWLSAHIVRGTLGPPTLYGGTSQYPACPAPISASLCPGGGDIDYSGYSLGAPPVSVTASVRQVWPLPGGAALEGFVGTHIDAASWGIYAHVPGTHLPATTRTDLSLTFHPAGRHWSIAGWIKNIENTATLSALATNSIYGQAPASIEAPRTFGARFGFNFGG